MKQGLNRGDLHLRERNSRRRIKALPVRSLAPNILTVLALSAGLTAIKFAIDGEFRTAIAAIVVAGGLDGLDGRIARLLKGTTKFGAELDSLSDFANFGFVPVTVAYIWSLNELGGVGWIVVLTFCICSALRLARFNVSAEDPDRPAWKSEFFIGVPSPAAAGLCIAPFFPYFLGFEAVREWAPLLAVYTIFVSLLMVSQIPTYSGKIMKIKREHVLPMLLMVALFAALLFMYPWYTLSGCAITYLITIPMSMWSYKEKLAQNGETEEAIGPGEFME
jgi:CDP-diacylglycerol--serine O-phosphatidyltransferase